MQPHIVAGALCLAGSDRQRSSTFVLLLRLLEIPKGRNDAIVVVPRPAHSQHATISSTATNCRRVRHRQIQSIKKWR